MNTLTSILVILTGILLRLVVPLVLTALVVIVLRKLDARWQAEAERESKMLLNGEVHCWKEEGLPSSEIKLRLTKGERPCWQSCRLSNGNLREKCLDCEVFHDAPVPVSRQHVHI
jgi:hypothetical protein